MVEALPGRPYFIDVMLGPGDQGLRLRGEIMTEDDSDAPALISASLHDSDGTLVRPDHSGGTAGAAGGAFAFDLERGGDYRVELVFGREAVSIAGLNVQ